MKKRLISALIAASMLFTSFAAVSAADSDVVATVDGKDVTLGNLEYKLSSNNTAPVKLIKDILISNYIEKSGVWDSTLDLNGHTITFDEGRDSANPAIYVSKGKLTITDSSAGKTGKIVAPSKYTKPSAIQCGVDGSEIQNSELVIEGGTFDAAYAVFAAKRSAVTINGGTFNGKYANVYTNGSYEKTTVTINGGTFNTGMYLAAKNSTYEINGGTFIGNSDRSAVEVKGGTMTVKDGNFINASGTHEVAANITDGSSSGGYALAVIGQDDYGPADVTVSGGTFNGFVELVNKGTTVSKLTITGGTFENEITAPATGSGYTLKPYIAEVGVTQYRSLPAAIANASACDTVKIIDKADLAYTVAVDKNITLDLNGKTISYTANSSARAISVQPGATLTVKDSGTNGTIKAAQVAVQCAQGKEGNRAGLILESGTLDADYAIFARGYSDVTVNGGTVKGTQTVYTNGAIDRGYGGNTITINDGTFEGGMYLAAGNSTYTINGGTFTTDKATYTDEKGTISTIEIKGGNLTVNGGTFTTDADSQALPMNGNGQSSRGYLLAVVGQAAYSDVNVDIKGGTFNGKLLLTGLAEEKYKDAVTYADNSVTVARPKSDIAEAKTITATLSLKGGSYTDDISKYVADNCVVLKADGLYNVKALTKTDITANAVSADDAAKITEDLAGKIEGTSEKIDTFTLTGGASFVRAAYPITGTKNDTINVDFDMSSVENLGTAKFGILFYNIPAGITVGDAVISTAE